MKVPAETPAPKPMPSTDFGLGCSMPGRWPTMRCSFMSYGSVVASTWPFTSTSKAPSFHWVMATEELRPSAVYRILELAGGNGDAAAVGDQFAGNGVQILRQHDGRRPWQRASSSAESIGLRFGDIRAPGRTARWQRTAISSRRCELLRADPRNQHQADAQRAHDGAQGVGGIDAADHLLRILRRGRATAARASGKLAPQSSVGGRIAHRQRTRSSWKVCQGLT